MNSYRRITRATRTTKSYVIKVYDAIRMLKKEISNSPILGFTNKNAYNMLDKGSILDRPGKTNPKLETRTKQLESIPELTSEMGPTDFNPTT